jgi:trehalose 6-phosphate phosphatase
MAADTAKPSCTPPLPAPRDDWALFLDVDGTLVEIAETPEGVTPDHRLPDILSAVSRRLGGAVALVSGRRVDTLDRFFAPLRLPAAGLHGLERRDAAGDLRRAPPTPAIREAAEKARAFAAAHPGVLLEDKGATVALHFRQAPEAGPAATAFAEALTGALRGTILQKGKMVVEIRPAGADKGSVIAAFMTEAPFRDRTPVFAGDDVTDEAGFAMVNSLQGHSIRIGDGAATAARYRLPTVAALLGWLESWR